MLLDNVDSDLQQLGRRLFKVVRDLSGSEPELESSSGWYKAASADGVFAYFYFLGPRARRYPPNSLHLVAKWDESLNRPDVEASNNWFGGHPSADLIVKPG